MRVSAFERTFVGRDTAARKEKKQINLGFSNNLSCPG